MLTVKIKGGGRIAAQLEEGIARAHAETLAELRRAGDAMADRAAARVRAQRDPSRPGRSALARSIVSVRRADGAHVQATAPHAVFVELGTARMEAEPFLGPAFLETVSQLRRRWPEGGTP